MSCLPCCGTTSPPPPEPPISCFSIDTLMSQNGLVTDCHAGIKPQFGEILAVQMQANGWVGFSVPARPIVFGYALSKYKDIVQTKSGLPPLYKAEPDGGYRAQESPCNFIWWTKNRCLGNQDSTFPGANTSGCLGTWPGFIGCNNYVVNTGYRGSNCNFSLGGGLDIAWEWPNNYTWGSSPSTSQNLLCGLGLPDECSFAAGGPAQFEAFDCGGECEPTNTCCSLVWRSGLASQGAAAMSLAAEFDENAVGSYISEAWDYQMVKRKFSFKPIYPSATKEEIRSSMYKNTQFIGCPHNNTDLKIDSVIKGCGLTPYQERVSEHLNPDIWEILQFNSKKPIVILHREFEPDFESKSTGLDIVGTIPEVTLPISVTDGAKDIAAGPDFFVALAVMKAYECVDHMENVISGPTGPSGEFTYCYKTAGFGSDVLISLPHNWIQDKGITHLSGIFRAWTDSNTFPYYNTKKISRGLRIGCDGYESSLYPEFTPRQEGEMFGYENQVTFLSDWSPPSKLSAGGERCIITRKNGATVTSTGYPVGGYVSYSTKCVGWDPQWGESVARDGDLFSSDPNAGQWCRLGPHTETILFDRTKDHMGSATVPYSPVSTGVSFNWVCQNNCDSCKIPWIGPVSEPTHIGGCPCFYVPRGINPTEISEQCSNYYQSEYYTCNGTPVNTETSIPNGFPDVCDDLLGGKTGTFVENVLWIKDNGEFDIIGKGTDLCRGVQSWKQISCGMHHNVAINNYGITGGSNVFCWGASYANQTQFNSQEINLAKKVSAGYYHSLALRNNGTIWAWGGGGTFNKGQASIAGFSDVIFKDIAAGKFHSCGIKQDGTVFCWGAGTSGASGAEDFGQSNPPAVLTNINDSNFTPSTSIACGAYHTCVILGDGGLTCWGHSGDNRLNFDTSNKKYIKVVCGEKFSAAKWVPTGLYRSYPIVLPKTNEIIATGNWPHNLFKYFFTFVSQQFSYTLGQMDCLDDGSFPSNILMNRSMPAFFHQISDAVHLFSFEFPEYDSDLQDCIKAICEESNWEEGYALGYNKQQLMSQDSIQAIYQAHSDDKWHLNVNTANDLLGTKFKDRLQLKDWRGEIWNDMALLSRWAADNGISWSELTDLLTKYDNPSKIKCVGPARLPGDIWEIRAAADDSESSTNNPFKPFEANMSQRAPALAKMATPKPGTEWPACYTDTSIGGSESPKTLQVNKDIYQLELPLETNINALPQDAQRAFYRLTNSVYFRSRAILPNWEWSPRNFTALSSWPDEEDEAHWSKRNHRYAWLQKAGRTISPYPNKSLVDRYSVVQSLGPNTSAAAARNQSYWSISGQGHAFYPVIEGGIMADTVCDLIWGAKMAHLGNSSSFIGRYIPAFASDTHKGNHKQQPPFIVSGGAQMPTNLWPNTSFGSGISIRLRPIPHPDSINESSLTSNICFGRFVGRSYAWDNSEVPYSLKYVADPKDHPVDSKNVCSEIPSPIMHPQELSRPYNNTGMMSIGTGGNGPWFQQWSLSGMYKGLYCQGRKPAEGIAEWDGPGTMHAGDSGPYVRAGWFNNFVFDPETGMRSGASGCTLIFDRDCCINYTNTEFLCCNKSDWNEEINGCHTFSFSEGGVTLACKDLTPNDAMFKDDDGNGMLTACDCSYCQFAAWDCVKQIRCNEWIGPTYGLYEPTVGASLSGGVTGNACCFINETSPSRWEEGNPLYSEWRSNAFLSLPPIHPTPKHPDGCQNREKASCCYWEEYQPGEFTVSGKHFKTYPSVNPPTLAAPDHTSGSNMCYSDLADRNPGVSFTRWYQAIKLQEPEALSLMSPRPIDVLVRGRMMCLENEIDPEWQHSFSNPKENLFKACIPKGITLGNAGAFSYLDFRMQATECDADLVSKLNKMISGLTLGGAHYKFTRCYNSSDINPSVMGGCTSSFWPDPTKVGGIVYPPLPIPNGWPTPDLGCGETGCCYCLGRPVTDGDPNPDALTSYWQPYGSFENYCKSALNGNYRATIPCPRGKGQNIIKEGIEQSEFPKEINAYNFNCNTLGLGDRVKGPGTRMIPIECLNCTIGVTMGECISEIFPVEPLWQYALVKFNPIGYFIRNTDSGGFSSAGKDGYCRTPIHRWPDVYDANGNDMKSDQNGGWSVNSLDMVYSGPCWPHPGLWDNAENIDEGKIPLSSETSLTWQPCQRGIYLYDDDTQKWKHTPGIVSTEQCQTETVSYPNGINCCEYPKNWAPRTTVTYIPPDEWPEGLTTETAGGLWRKPILAVPPYSAPIVQAGRCLNENPTPGNCWVCPGYKAPVQISGSPCVLDVEGSCNCGIPSGEGQTAYRYLENGVTLGWCKCEPPVGCPSDLICEERVCQYQSSCCEIEWTEDCSNVAKNLCDCSQYQCPCECRNYEALKWSADKYNVVDGWTGGKTTGLDLLINPQDCEGITCDDCRKCDLPLCIHKYNCNLKCPCGTYGMNCEKTCMDNTGYYGEYDKEFLSKGTIVWRTFMSGDSGGGGSGDPGGGGSGDSGGGEFP